MRLPSTHSVGSSGGGLIALSTVALVAAGAGWLAPLPSFRPSAESPTDGGPDGTNATIKLPGPLEPDQWQPLEAVLGELRPEPPPEQPVDPVEDAPPVDTNPQPAIPTQSLPKLGWTYAGYADEGDTIFALIVLADGRQRPVSEGQTLDEPGIGSVTIKSITPSEITLERPAGAIERIPYSPGTTSKLGPGSARVPGSGRIQPGQPIPTRNR